jgi:hypothetical protein
VALTPAERQRAHRERKRAEREAAEAAAAQAAADRALAERIEAEAARQVALLDQAVDASGGLVGAPLVERALGASKELVLRLWGNPLVRMAQLAATPTRELAQQLGGASLLEVRKLQHQADAELADRLFGKAPLAIRNDGAPAVQIQLAVTPGLAAAIGGRVVEAQADQGFAEGEAA